eukprot:TRINITY_DN17319_c0_g2_i4.p1 TRINITY_DN17319_c0_g2~~TRINITY_DN17319_c0_g2_i4.p1  ORF type:complete len:444 (+),score=68.75 TRINITY_DN17319_c0_g2_i4:256-1587(+)
MSQEFQEHDDPMEGVEEESFFMQVGGGQGQQVSQFAPYPSQQQYFQLFQPGSGRTPTPNPDGNNVQVFDNDMDLVQNQVQQFWAKYEDIQDPVKLKVTERAGGGGGGVGGGGNAFLQGFPPFQQFPTNFSAGLSSAFDLLEEGARVGVTAGCKKVILFLTDGRDLSGVSKPQLHEMVRDRQEMLYNDTNEQAFIFTYSIGEDTDEDIVRQLACTYNGSWTKIESTNDPMNAFNAFIRHIAATRATPQFFWSEIYEDSWGLGTMITVTLPVYFSNNDQVNGFLYGVAGHDIPIRELEAVAGDRTWDLIDALQVGSLQCDTQSVSECQQQILRGRNSQCSDMVQIEECTTDSVILQGLSFLETVNVSHISNEDLFCEDHFSEPSLIENFSTLVCCPDCDDPNDEPICGIIVEIENSGVMHGLDGIVIFILSVLIPVFLIQIYDQI